MITISDTNLQIYFYFQIGGAGNHLELPNSFGFHCHGICQYQYGEFQYYYILPLTCNITPTHLIMPLIVASQYLPFPPVRLLLRQYKNIVCKTFFFFS